MPSNEHAGTPQVPVDGNNLGRDERPSAENDLTPSHSRVGLLALVGIVALVGVLVLVRRPVFCGDGYTLYERTGLRTCVSEKQADFLACLDQSHLTYRARESENGEIVLEVGKQPADDAGPHLPTVRVSRDAVVVATRSAGNSQQVVLACLGQSQRLRADASVGDAADMLAAPAAPPVQDAAARSVDGGPVKRKPDVTMWRPRRPDSSKNTRGGGPLKPGDCEWENCNLNDK